MYPTHTQLLAKWSSPSIGDQRATEWRRKQCSLAPREEAWSSVSVFGRARLGWQPPRESQASIYVKTFEDFSDLAGISTTQGSPWQGSYMEFEGKKKQNFYTYFMSQRKVVVFL